MTACYVMMLRCTKPCAVSTLSQKSETVAENGETTAKFGDCRTFLRQCGQAFTMSTFLLMMEDELMRRSAHYELFITNSVTCIIGLLLSNIFIILLLSSV